MAMRDTTCATTSSMYVDVCVAAAELTDAPKRNSTTGVVGLGADRADEAPPVPEGGGKAFGSELLRLTDRCRGEVGRSLVWLLSCFQLSSSKRAVVDQGRIGTKLKSPRFVGR